MEGLARLTKLRSLDLSGIDPDTGTGVGSTISDAGLASLAKLTDLRSLSLGFCLGVRGPGLVVLESLPRLESLDLKFTVLGEEAIARLHRLPSLRELSLSGCNRLSGEALQSVVKIVGLRRLDLTGCTALTADDLARLAGLRELEVLDLTICNGDKKRVGIAGWQPLEGDGIGLSDAAVAALAGLPLTELRLCGCNALTDAIGASLARMKRLRRLDLRGLPNLRGKNLLDRVSPDLVELRFDRSGIDGAVVLDAVRRFPKLEVLDIAGLANLDDAALERALAGVRLRTLFIGFTNAGAPPTSRPGGSRLSALTSAAAVVIAKQTELVELDARYATWLDRDALLRFATLPKLAVLNLHSASIETGLVEGLASSWPGCVITLPSGKVLRVPEHR